MVDRSGLVGQSDFMPAPRIEDNLPDHWSSQRRMQFRRRMESRCPRCGRDVTRGVLVCSTCRERDSLLAHHRRAAAAVTLGSTPEHLYRLLIGPHPTRRPLPWPADPLRIRCLKCGDAKPVRQPVGCLRCGAPLWPAGMSRTAQKWWAKQSPEQVRELVL